ncbi:phosphomevalonate kinase [Cladophialophora bantiana CBS 173.52]|uniref:Phosphomevalonate kinase n=1 Tax=Cladophialophora bantiana (strain ATCC 10958 / CBS 173.52 / CDC B-1940 / NIH 8579) TaxID=1442370 RepID=A0A0D2F702_CLAB1|nr:phosphomevalonate kinase [Cladophialophora bantiana CBS 173.52]KIW97901.1 phosphomevalonate kinase [Cladophialophora bantiana CBS 173.52]
MSPPAVVAVSAPGKVLFAGGFLVLDRQHTGLVFGLNARIHVVVQPWRAGDLLPGSLNSGPHVLVQSPQFCDARWLYRIDGSAAGSGAVTVEQVRDHKGAGSFTASANRFVETTLRYALTYLSHVSGGSHHVFEESIKVTILADDDYYSQSQPQSPEPSAAKSTRFTSFGVKLSEAHKTGLGSSAALVTAFVSALLAFYSKRDAAAAEEIPPNHQTIHNLAQAAHCAAQGKVGSGFDVAAAVYGSCLYRRFTPSILENVGEPTSAGFGERLHRCVDDLDLDARWDVEIASRAVQISASLSLVMCDVDCGSETPGMVKKVLQWRKENIAEATLLWTALQQGQEELCRELRRLVEVQGIENDFTALGDIILTIRSLVREMSVKSKVPIEPPVITELLDFCTSLPGVVGGVAPGAGGYDAVSLLVKNDGESVKGLQARLKGWKSQDASGATIGHVRLLGVKQDNEGIRVENVGQYEVWL